MHEQTMSARKRVQSKHEVSCLGVVAGFSTCSCSYGRDARELKTSQNGKSIGFYLNRQVGGPS